MYCGIARMVTDINLNKTFDFWFDEIRWRGFFQLKWLMIKDVEYKFFNHLIVNKYLDLDHPRRRKFIRTVDGFRLILKDVTDFYKIYEKSESTDNIFECFDELDDREIHKIRFGRDQINKIVTKMHKHDIFNKHVKKKLESKDPNFFSEDYYSKTYIVQSLSINDIKSKNRQMQSFGRNYNNFVSSNRPMYNNYNSIPSSNNQLTYNQNTNNTPSDLSEIKEEISKLSITENPKSENNKKINRKSNQTLQISNNPQSSILQTNSNLYSYDSSFISDYSMMTMSNDSSIMSKKSFVETNQYYPQQITKKSKNRNERSFDNNFKREGEKSIYGKDSFLKKE